MQVAKYFNLFKLNFNFFLLIQLNLINGHLKSQTHRNLNQIKFGLWTFRLITKEKNLPHFVEFI